MRTLITIISLLFLSTLSHAQDSFTGGLIAGITTSTTNGDGAGGFHKFGISAGGFVARELNQHVGIGFELRFSQKGAADQVGNKLNLGYIETPLLFTYQLNEDFTLKAGGGLAIEMYEYTTVGVYKSWPNDFRNYDIPAYFGAEYAFQDKMGIDLRGSFSAIPIPGSVSGKLYTHICLYATTHFYFVN